MSKPRARKLPSPTLPTVVLGGVALFLAWAAPGAAARDAYVTNQAPNSVSVIDTATNQAVGQPIQVGEGPREIAITPDGSHAYVSNRVSEDVYEIDTATNTVVGAPIAIGDDAIALAITPDGSRLYVARLEKKSVVAIDTATNQIVGEPIEVGAQPRGIAITPDGSRAYVANKSGGTVSVIETRTDTVIATIPVSSSPRSIAITPDGSRAYVTCKEQGLVFAIDTRTDTVIGNPIAVGGQPSGIAITPDGNRAYTADEESDTVSVIDTTANAVLGGPIAVGAQPRSVAITPDGRRAYVVNENNSDSLSVIDTATNQVVGAPIPVGHGPFGIALVPDQAPSASFRTLRARPGVPTVLDASGSKDPDGTVAAFAWDFGDGQTAAVTSATLTHTYARPGSYRLGLRVTDNEGCSASLIFTGQTALCNGGATASAAGVLDVAYPGVRARCPKRSGPAGCRFALRVIAAKPKHGRGAKVESAVARAKVKPGLSAIVLLKAKAKFAKKLAVAKRVLVEETVRAGGSRRTRIVKLKIVQ